MDCNSYDDGWWCVVKEQRWGTSYEVNSIVKYNREITWQSSLQEEILVCGYLNWIERKRWKHWNTNDNRI